MTAGSTLVLAHEVAQLAALLPGADNAERQALQAIHQAIVPSRLGQATEEEVRTTVAALANGAFMRGPDLSRPECWMLGLVSSLLGACSAVELHSSSSAASGVAGSDLGQFVATQVARTFVAVARTLPSSFPLGVTPKLYRVVCNDVARRMEGAAELAMRKHFGTGGPLQ